MPIKSAAQLVNEAEIGHRMRRELAHESRQRAARALEEALTSLNQPLNAREAELRRARNRVTLQIRDLEALLARSTTVADQLDQVLSPIRGSKVQSDVESADLKLRIVERAKRLLEERE